MYALLRDLNRTVKDPDARDMTPGTILIVEDNECLRLVMKSKIAGEIQPIPRRHLPVTVNSFRDAAVVGLEDSTAPYVEQMARPVSGLPWALRALRFVEHEIQNLLNTRRIHPLRRNQVHRMRVFGQGGLIQILN